MATYIDMLFVGYLKHFQGARPNMVRVYSDRIERLEFPLPQDTLGIPGKKNKDHGMPLEHKVWQKTWPDPFICVLLQKQRW